MSNLVNKLMYGVMGVVSIGNSLSYVHKPELTFRTQEYRSIPSKKGVCELRSLLSQEYVKLNHKQFIPDLENAKSIIQVGLFESKDKDFQYPHAVYNFQKSKHSIFVDIVGPHRNYQAMVYQLKNANAFIEFERKGFDESDLKFVVDELTKECPSGEDIFMNEFEDKQILD